MKTWQAVTRTDNNISPLSSTLAQITSAWKWLEHKRTQQLATRRLKVAETISLGEKRFVSILNVDGAQFLIGGSAGNVSLLAVLDKPAGVTSTEQPS